MTDTYIETGTAPNLKYTILKDPDAVLDYIFNWEDWLDDVLDTITSHEMVAETGITVDSSTIEDKTVVAWISGGEVGTTYRLASRIVTAGGRTDDRSIYIKIKER
jgi:hypothetical protein